MSQADIPAHLLKLIDAFSDMVELRSRLCYVLSRLPGAILSDLDDPHFRITLDQCEPGIGRTVWMPDLHPNGCESRCVVLKPRLQFCEADFAHYIIAHELAHAVLRNQGNEWTDDREEAADSLAASWGFDKPAQRFWFW